MTDLAAFVRRKWRWAREKPYAWASLALVAGTFIVLFVWPGPSDTRLRLWSLGLQLIGAWNVWHDPQHGQQARAPRNHPRHS